MEPAENTSNTTSSEPISSSPHPEVEAPSEPAVIKPEEQNESIVVPTDTKNQAASATIPKEGAGLPQHKGSQPGVLVLQWLTYAFWLWFAASMAWLIAVTLNFFIAGDDIREWGTELAYPLAATIVMLLVALSCDVVYARFESRNKQGASSVIMLIHAVIFGLMTVGAMITALFAMIMMLVNSDPVDTVDGAKVTIATALVMMVLLGAMFVRVLLVDKIRQVRKIFWGVMAAAALGFVIASIAGPVVHANLTKDDRLIEEALPTLAEDISTYARKNNKLPEKLSDVTSSDSYARKKVQAMLDKQLVTYKANIKPAEQQPTISQFEIGRQPSASIYPGVLSRQTFFYQLCTTYKTEKNQEKSYEYTEPANGMDRGMSLDDSYYSSSQLTYAHKKGQVCYDLSTDESYPYWELDRMSGPGAAKS